MASQLSIELGSWHNVFRRVERFWLPNPNPQPANQFIPETDDCVVLNSDGVVGVDVIEMPGVVYVKRDLLLQATVISQIALGYTDVANASASNAFQANETLVGLFGYRPFLEYTGVTTPLSSVEVYDEYRLKFFCIFSSHESYVSGYVYLCPGIGSLGLFTTSAGVVNFYRPKIRVCRAPLPRVVMEGDSLYESRVKVYSVFHTSSVFQIGAVPVRDKGLMVSGRSLVGDDREAVFGVSFGGGGLNGHGQFWANVRRVWVETPFGRVRFVENDVPREQRVVWNFEKQVYDTNGGVPMSWRVAPKKNGYVYVGFPTLSYNTVEVPSRRSAQGILLYWRDFSVFPAGFSGVVPCEVVVESIVGEVRRSFSVQVIGRSVKYRYSDYVSAGTIEFVAGEGSSMYHSSELQSFFDGIYVLDGSVVEEYGYDSYVGAGERVIFPNVLRLEMRVDGTDVFEKVVNIIGGVRFFDSDGRLIFSGDIETSAGERRVSYNSVTEVVSVEFQNGILKILKEKLLTAEGEFDRNQLLEFFSIKPFEVLDGGGYDFALWFEKNSNDQRRYRTSYSVENPPAFFTLGFWLRHFARILGLNAESVPVGLVIPDIRLEVLVFNCAWTGIGSDGRRLSDQWYEVEEITEVDLMRFVVSAQKVMGATDGDRLSATVGEALGRLLSLFDLRIFISGDNSFRVVSSFIPSGGDVEEVEVLEGYTEKVLQGREKDFVYMFPLYRPVVVGGGSSDYVNEGRFPAPASNWVLDYKLLDNTLFTTPNMYFNSRWSLYGEARYSTRVEPRFGEYYSAGRLREGVFRIESSFLHIPAGYNEQISWAGDSSVSTGAALLVLFGVYLGRTLAVDFSSVPASVLLGIPNRHSFAASNEYFYGVPALLDVGLSHHYNGHALGRLSRHSLFYLRKVVDQDGLSVEKPVVLLPSPGGSMIQVSQPRPSWFKLVPSVWQWLWGSPNGTEYEGMEDYMGIVYRVWYKGEWKLLHEFEAERIWEQVRRNVVGIDGEIVGVYDRVGNEVMYKGKRYKVMRAEPKRGEGKTRVVLKRIY